MLLRQFKNINKILKPKSEEDIQREIQKKIESNPQRALEFFVRKVVPQGILEFLSVKRHHIFIDVNTTYEIRKIQDHSSPNIAQENIDFIVGSKCSIFLLVYIGIYYSSKILDQLFEYFPEQTEYVYNILKHKYDIDKITFMIDDSLYEEKRVEPSLQYPTNIQRGIYIQNYPSSIAGDTTA